MGGTGLLSLFRFVTATQSAMGSICSIIVPQVTSHIYCAVQLTFTSLIWCFVFLALQPIVGVFPQPGSGL
jgi:hypothetical protein